MDEANSITFVWEHPLRLKWCSNALLTHSQTLSYSFHLCLWLRISWYSKLNEFVHNKSTINYSLVCFALYKCHNLRNSLQANVSILLSSNLIEPKIFSFFFFFSAPPKIKPSPTNCWFLSTMCLRRTRISFEFFVAQRLWFQVSCVVMKCTKYHKNQNRCAWNHNILFDLNIPTPMRESVNSIWEHVCNHTL